MEKMRISNRKKHYERISNSNLDESHGKLKSQRLLNKRNDNYKNKESVVKEKANEKNVDMKITQENISKIETKVYQEGTLDKVNIKISEQALQEGEELIKEMPAEGKLKLFSWNINGVRALKGKGSLELLIKNESPDIICFNETKIDNDTLISEKINLLHSEIYASYWNCCKNKKGYSGVGILTKYKPLKVIYEIGIPEHDLEGRMIALEYPELYIVCVYVPNAGGGLRRLDYRVNNWDKCLQSFVKNLASQKHLILTGDLNVAHHEIDVYAPKRMEGGACFTKEERESFGNFLQDGFVDTFRHFHPNEVKYSYFTFRSGNKGPNHNDGWRLDYFIVDQNTISKVEESDILTQYRGSDHRPIKLIYRLGKIKEKNLEK